MIEITKYLQTVYEDLQRYVDNDVCLCKFKELNFEAGALPDYEDINIQQLYLLRYAFAYAFEYSRMYLDVLSQMDGVNGISVTSVGCGSMIDYWSLVHKQHYIPQRILDNPNNSEIISMPKSAKELEDAIERVYLKRYHTPNLSRPLRQRNSHI